MFIKIKDKNGVAMLLNTNQVVFIAEDGNGQCWFEFNNHCYLTSKTSFSEIEEMLQKGANNEN